MAKKTTSQKLAGAGRWESAKSAKDEIEKWCKKHRWHLDIFNDNQHWVFRKGKVVAEWWPSSARLVIDKRYREHLYCPEWHYVMEEIDGEN